MNSAVQRVAVLGSVVAAIASVGLIVFWFGYVTVLPYDEIRAGLGPVVSDPDWVWVNATGLGASICALLTVPAVSIVQLERAGKLGLWALFAALTGGVLLTLPLAWDLVLWPTLYAHDPRLLRFDGPILTSTLFVPFFVFCGLAWAVGWALLGAAVSRAGVLPRVAGRLWTVGAPLFALGVLAGPWQAAIRTLGLLLVVAGLARVAMALLSLSRRHLAADQRPV